MRVITSNQRTRPRGHLVTLPDTSMLFTLRPRRIAIPAIALMYLIVCPQLATAQTADVTAGETDPIKLFERGQNAHAKGELERAVALYEGAIKLRPEFPEAEYQRGVALVALDRPREAETAFNRAIDLRKDWVLAYKSLGALLTRLGRDKEAEPALRRALQLGATDYITFDSLSTVRSRAGDKEAALALARRATEDTNASALAWAWRGAMERAAGNLTAALSSLDHALEIEPSVNALRERAELRIDARDYEHAIEDLKRALLLVPGDKEISLRLARVYQLDNKPEEMRRIYESLGYTVSGPGVSGPQAKGIINVVGAPADIEAANSDDPKVAAPALDKLIPANPKNAALLARLGEVTRRTDPARSADAYRRANEIDAANPRYAIGYAAALVQLRRFAEATALLRRVIVAVPDDYTAHANLALALYEMKDYVSALTEYQWLVAARPEVAAAYFYLATTHDNLEHYEQALDAYEDFLSRADPANNKLEIEKVNLRLPILRDQIKRGQGRKQKKP